MKHNYLHHQQEYTNHTTILIKSTNLPFDIIKNILTYSGSKNYLTIYKDCLKEFMKRIEGTKVVFYQEQIYGHDQVYVHNKDIYAIFRIQMNMIFLKRYIPTPETEELNDLEKLFYITLMGIETFSINTIDVFSTTDY